MLSHIFMVIIQVNLQDFVEAKLYCQHAPADGIQHTLVMKKTLSEVSPTVLPTPSQ